MSFASPQVRSFTVRFARVLGYVVYFWLLVSLVILTLGFFLRLFAANPDAGFVEWVYRNLDRTMEPFRGMFPEQALGDGASVLDVSILFAMLMYGIVALAIRALIDWLTFRMHRIDREMTAVEPATATPVREAGSPPPAAPRDAVPPQGGGAPDPYAGSPGGSSGSTEPPA